MTGTPANQAAAASDTRWQRMSKRYAIDGFDYVVFGAAVIMGVIDILLTLANTIIEVVFHHHGHLYYAVTVVTGLCMLFMGVFAMLEGRARAPRAQKLLRLLPGLAVVAAGVVLLRISQ